MIPKVEDLKDIEFESFENKTYKMVLDKNRIIGQDDGIEVIKQAIYKILNTERYDFVIYSNNYGIELKELFGLPIDYVEVDAERRIKEALLQDDRIKDCIDFEFKRLDKNSLIVNFKVLTIYGELEINKEVLY